jgi:hypothetical protein
VAEFGDVFANELWATRPNVSELRSSKGREVSIKES